MNNAPTLSSLDDDTKAHIIMYVHPNDLSAHEIIGIGQAQIEYIPCKYFKEIVSLFLSVFAEKLQKSMLFDTTGKLSNMLQAFDRFPSRMWGNNPNVLAKREKRSRYYELLKNNIMFKFGLNGSLYRVWPAKSRILKECSVSKEIFFNPPEAIFETNIFLDPMQHLFNKVFSPNKKTVLDICNKQKSYMMWFLHKSCQFIDAGLLLSIPIVTSCYCAEVVQAVHLKPAIFTGSVLFDFIIVANVKIQQEREYRASMLKAEAKNKLFYRHLIIEPQQSTADFIEGLLNIGISNPVYCALSAKKDIVKGFKDQHGFVFVQDAKHTLYQVKPKFNTLRAMIQGIMQQDHHQANTALLAKQGSHSVYRVDLQN